MKIKNLKIYVLVDRTEQKPKEPNVHRIYNSVVATLGLMVSILTFVYTFFVK